MLAWQKRGRVIRLTCERPGLGRREAVPGHGVRPAGSPPGVEALVNFLGRASSTQANFLWLELEGKEGGME